MDNLFKYSKYADDWKRELERDYLYEMKIRRRTQESNPYGVFFTPFDFVWSHIRWGEEMNDRLKHERYVGFGRDSIDREFLNNFIIDYSSALKPNKESGKMRNVDEIVEEIMKKKIPSGTLVIGVENSKSSIEKMERLIAEDDGSRVALLAHYVKLMDCVLKKSGAKNIHYIIIDEPSYKLHMGVCKLIRTWEYIPTPKF
ncbi:MAG: hypothetical protein ACRCZ2_00640 [Fusobacteriaceae bacterium]